MRRLRQRIGDAWRGWLHGVVKQQPQPKPPGGSFRVVKSEDGKYAIQRYSDYSQEWELLGGVIETATEARRQMQSLVRWRDEKAAVEARTWKPLDAA